MVKTRDVRRRRHINKVHTRPKNNNQNVWEVGGDEEYKMNTKYDKSFGRLGGGGENWLL